MRTLSESERNALKIIARNIWAQNGQATQSMSPDEAFIQGFLIGRQYTIDQLDLLDDEE